MPKDKPHKAKNDKQKGGGSENSNALDDAKKEVKNTNENLNLIGVTGGTSDDESFATKKQELDHLDLSDLIFDDLYGTGLNLIHRDENGFTEEELRLRDEYETEHFHELLLKEHLRPDDLASVYDTRLLKSLGIEPVMTHLGIAGPKNAQNDLITATLMLMSEGGNPCLTEAYRSAAAITLDSAKPIEDPETRKYVVDVLMKEAARRKNTPYEAAYKGAASLVKEYNFDTEREMVAEESRALNPTDDALEPADSAYLAEAHLQRVVKGLDIAPAALDRAGETPARGADAASKPIEERARHADPSRERRSAGGAGGRVLPLAIITAAGLQFFHTESPQEERYKMPSQWEALICMRFRSCRSIEGNSFDCRSKDFSCLSV